MIGNNNVYGNRLREKSKRPSSIVEGNIENIEKECGKSGLLFCYLVSSRVTLRVEHRSSRTIGPLTTQLLWLISRSTARDKSVMHTAR